MGFKTLIVGLGQIGMGYDLHLEQSNYIYSHARAFALHPDFQLVAGVDSDAQNRLTFEKAYHCPSYENMNAAIHVHCPEVVVIALPTELHAETLRQVLNASGVKVVLCEKPLSYDLEDARAMVAGCEFKGVQLYVNYMRRSDPGMFEVKQRIDAGEIATPIKGLVWYSKGFLHNGSHFFNLMEYWLGSMQDSTIVSKGRFWGKNDQEPDVQVVFERGVVVFMAAWEEAFSHYTIELLSPSGRLRCERGGKQIYWEPAQQDPDIKGYTTLSSEAIVIVSGMARYQWNVVEELAEVLRGREAQLCSGVDALRTLEDMNQILEKA